MKKLFTITAFLLGITLALTSCGQTGINTQVPDEGLVQTSVAQTVVALQTALSAKTTPITQAATATPTQEVIATFTSIATIPPATAVPLPTSTTQISYKISDVQDITVPDNTVFKPGEKFTKTWRMTNGGSGTWTADFKLVFVSGDAMSAPATVTVGRSVAPNQTVDISVNLVAPATPNTYTGNFMLQTNGGSKFGIGADASSVFWVKIKVETSFQVTKAIANVTPTSYTGVCPFSLSFSATITASGPGSVTYTYVTSTGTSKVYTMVFDAAGTKTSAVETWTLKASTSLVVFLYIDNPNHQDFASVTIPVTCTP